MKVTNSLYYIVPAKHHGAQSHRNEPVQLCCQTPPSVQLVKLTRDRIRRSRQYYGGVSRLAVRRETILLHKLETLESAQSAVH